jgi:ferritin-like metal-binding protein YciE
MTLPQVTPDQITAALTGLAGIITAWKIARKVERKSIFNGDEDQYERRTDSISKTEHMQCKKDRERTESRLEKNQEKLEKGINDNRLETKNDIQRLEDHVQKIGDEGRSGRDLIFSRLESDRKEILRKLDKMNGGR